MRRRSWDCPRSSPIVLLVERMNGLRNGASATVEERTAFQRAATLLVEFRDLGVASWAQQSGAAGRYELILSHYSPDHITEVLELLRLLELKGDPARESMIRIPVALGIREGDFDGLAVQTRSVLEIMRTAAAGSTCLASISTRASWRRARTFQEPWECARS